MNNNIKKIDKVKAFYLVNVFPYLERWIAYPNTGIFIEQIKARIFIYLTKLLVIDCLMFLEVF